VSHGFVLEKGVLTTVDYPGATVTDVLAINSRGSLAGAYVDASAKTHAFLLTRSE
jgi:uncharacterized membrane protein